jgi:hypothetical protein
MISSDLQKKSMTWGGCTAGFGRIVPVCWTIGARPIVDSFHDEDTCFPPRP